MGPKFQGKWKVVVDSKCVGNGVTSVGCLVIEEGVDESSEVGEEGGRVNGQAYYELVDENLGALWLHAEGKVLQKGEHFLMIGWEIVKVLLDISEIGVN